MSRAFKVITHRVFAAFRDEGGLIPVVKKSVSLLRTRGWGYLFYGEYSAGKNDLKAAYENWIRDKDSLTLEQLDSFKREADALAEQVKFSVILPVYKSNIDFLKAAVGSVTAQIYKNWELCISDDCSEDQALSEYLKDLQASGKQIKVTFRNETGHISANSNSALELASGDWVVFLDHDDLLSEDALFQVARAINRHPGVKMVYSDEDKLDSRGARCSPYFKPKLNRELLRGNNYICHLAAYRKDIIDQLGGLREGYEGAQDHDLALRVTERCGDGEVVHIPAILYHWRVHEGSTAGGASVKSYAAESGERAVRDHLDRLSLPASVARDNRGFYRVKYKIEGALPSVAIVIPTRDQLTLLKRCITSIIKNTSYANYTIYVADNDSTEPETLLYLRQMQDQKSVSVIKSPGTFNFSRINNNALKGCDEDYFLLLNNDIVVDSKNWLSDMVALAECQPDVGVVGSKLLYADGTVQHCGVVVGIGPAAGHALVGAPGEDLGYGFRGVVNSEFSAVTGACLLVAKDRYWQVGGLDETSFPVAFNDIDFCLKVQALGYRNVLVANSHVTHLESKSRGKEDSPEKLRRFSREVALFRQKWFHATEYDSCYNINLTRYGHFYQHEMGFSPRYDGLARSLRHAEPYDLDVLGSATFGITPSGISILKYLYPTDDTFGELIFLDMEDTELAAVVRRLRPHVETIFVVPDGSASAPWAELDFKEGLILYAQQYVALDRTPDAYFYRGKPLDAHTDSAEKLLHEHLQKRGTVAISLGDW